MKRLPSEKRFCVYFILTFASLAIIAFWYHAVWLPAHVDFDKYMSRECHPVWKDLELKRVQVGQTVEELLQTTSSMERQVHQFGDWALLTYRKGPFSRITIIAKHNRLVAAQASDAGPHVFFDVLSQKEWQNFSSALDDYELQRRLSW